jgi:putative nucleotidyltransferase with HDIG domain
MNTPLPLSRDEAFALLLKYISDDTLIKHSLASEAVMRAVAEELGEDPEEWGLAGLLHDIDFEETWKTPEFHGKIGAEILGEIGFSSLFTRAVISHNAEYTGIPRDSILDFALSCSESVTGLITAAALVRPDRKIETLKVKSVKKKFKDKSFARNVRRDLILLCREIGLELDAFLEIAISAMKKIHVELGI